MRKYHPQLFGNIIFGGLIGIIIDFASGSAYQLTPGEVEATLTEMQASLKKAGDGDVLVFVDFERLPEEVRRRIAAEQHQAA